MPVVAHGTEEGTDTVQESVRRRAYELFEMRGCEPGREMEDWLQAEQEILFGLESVIDEDAEPGSATNEEQLASKTPKKETRTIRSKIAAA